MSEPPAYRGFTIGLSLTAFVLALGLAVILAVFWRQSQALDDTARLQADSVTALTFQLEREFLRTRTHLRLGLANPATADWEQVQIRHEILASRIALLEGGSTIELLRQRPEFHTTMPLLLAWLAQADPLLQQPWENLPALHGLLARMDALGPDVQALSSAADSLMAHQMEAKVAQMRQQQRWLLNLLLFQVLVLLLAGLGLLQYQRRRMREHTALKKLNAELQQARLTAEQADRAKSQFLANMSHELRTPLHGVLGMLTLLADSPLSAAQRDQLATARQSSEHLLTLVSDLLDLTALDAGQLTLQPRAVNLRLDLAQSLQMLHPEAEQKGLALRWHDEGSASPWVLADATRVRQIVLNLLSNAIKFTDRGVVALHVACRLEGQWAHWQIAVHDSGIGMDAATQARLFQRFVQADDGLARRQGGSGLGLEISHTLAHLMGGQITVQSAPGQGSTFTLHLDTPLAPAAAMPTSPQAAASDGAAPDPVQPSTSAPAPGSTLDATPSSWHVLVAEDHPVNRKLVGLMLAKLGHRASFAENGRLALELAQQNDYDLVLMDIHMPEMDGLASARAIRALPGARGQVPIIALTADVMNDARERALRAGMNDFLSKPLQIDALRWALEQALVPGSTQAQAEAEPA